MHFLPPLLCTGKAVYMKNLSIDIETYSSEPLQK